ncbi:PstS family phosphate ABC transporter substrate-binding protein [Oceanicella actignis]|uniref:Phosphate transport system substrate-binding protein n=1 Tax=Oceanicella actignis TaxID=1189325 RepID=A0A1M7SS04_9RHOB|nr:PstS family phosphate ABC transporter substrate-binding protein [Oceanicella actignis]SES68087.1 phosphate ABC transporter substrate-binding protein, PhoT family (TC 3.A.1.7.1) [Oceanicella actignis]SHN61150.1 phosphate transport system substrate-binding protein [Oceanicella actignis]
MKANSTRILAMAALVAATAGAAQARDQIRVVGSSTVFPYSQAVAEEFANATGATPPVVESTGTGGGFKIFCQGVGDAHPDVTGASRAMKASEYKLCQEHGVTDVTEAMIGYDGLSIAVSRANKADWDLTETQIFLALAAQVPVNGAWADNPYRRWSEIDPSLPDVEILVYGPPPTSGTRDAFVELAMHDGCKALPYVQDLKAKMDGKAFKSWVKENCSRMRQDGPFIEAGENDNLIVQRLEADPDALGIFGYSFLYENNDRLKAVKVDGIEPNEQTIADFSYDIARPLFIYVKNAHRGVIPGLDEFLAEYVSDNALAPGGYLEERGLTPLPDDLRAKVQEDVLNAVPMAEPRS